MYQSYALGGVHAPDSRNNSFIGKLKKYISVLGIEPMTSCAITNESIALFLNRFNNKEICRHCTSSLICIQMLPFVES